MRKLRARFLITEINENDKYKRIKKNFECIINAAFLSGNYHNKAAAYHILGTDYETLTSHLRDKTKCYSFNKRYKLARKITSCITIEDLVNSYHYMNLKLEKY